MVHWNASRKHDDAEDEHQGQREGGSGETHVEISGRVYEVRYQRLTVAHPTLARVRTGPTSRGCDTARRSASLQWAQFRERRQDVAFVG